VDTVEVLDVEITGYTDTVGYSGTVNDPVPRFIAQDDSPIGPVSSGATDWKAVVVFEDHEVREIEIKDDTLLWWVGMQHPLPVGGNTPHRRRGRRP
jgi:hypothetical protein